MRLKRNLWICPVAFLGALLLLAPAEGAMANEATAQQVTAVRDSFRQANLKHGRPRIALFWNRVFSDELTTQYARYARFRMEHSLEAANATHTEAELTSGRRRDGDSGRVGPMEQTSWELESTFITALNNAGARLLDRAVLMRTLHGGRSAGESPDAQAIESQALIGKAELLMEVFVSPKAAAPAGVTFQINVKNVRSGEILVSFASDALPPARRGSYRPDTYGFSYEPHDPAAEEVGQQLAVEALRHLMTAWEQTP